MAERTVQELGEMLWKHAYMGLCPDETQPQSRDPSCPACAALEALTSRLSAAEAALSEARSERDIEQAMRNRAEAKLAEAQKDARRWVAFRHANSVLTLRLHNARHDMREQIIDAAIDAAMQQGADK